MTFSVLPSVLIAAPAIYDHCTFTYALYCFYQQLIQMTISGIDMFPNETLIQALILEMPHRYSSLQLRKSNGRSMRFVCAMGIIMLEQSEQSGMYYS